MSSRLIILFLLGFLMISAVFSSETKQPQQYTSEQEEQISRSAEQHSFQAEVRQLLDILVNSLYSHVEVFLRELISNGSDALGKIRFASLTNPDLLKSNPDLAIYIKPDLDNRILHIIDSGVGMTRDELVENLGRIAKSGTKDFLRVASSLEDAGDSNNLIGKFGVGFYSAFLVADTVRVTSKSNSDDTQWVWQSTADGSFTIAADPNGNTLGRGTQVSLYLKKNMDDYLDVDNLEQLIHKYSEFINFPIYLWSSHEETITVPKPQKHDDDEDEDKAIDLDEEEEEDDDDEEEEEETETIDVWGWERINAVQPIWTRDPATISEEQYNDFFKSISNDNQNPLAYSHFSAEGEINFKAILYVPSQAPANMFNGAAQTSEKPLKLFVKRVFITDDLEEMMPKYLPFIHGVVDSDDLDLNVSRETLQQSKTLGIIQKKLVRKAISIFQEMAADDPEKYDKFYKLFGTNIKWGYLEDRHNKQRLEKLMRFQSSKVDGLTGFDDYIERMKEGQDQIFYIAGQDKETLAASPLLEKLTKRGYEVLFLTEPIDEYVTQTLTRYGDHPLTNVAKEGLKLNEADAEEEAEKEEALNEKFSPLVAYLKKALGTVKVANVVVSHRLESVPAALVSGQWGWTANMERIAKAQALSEKSNNHMYKARRVLEINPTHPIIEALLDRIQIKEDGDETASNVASLIYHTALLTSGFELEDPVELSEQLQRVMSESLQVSSNSHESHSHEKDEL